MIKGGMAELLSPNRCFATTHDAVRFLHREATRSNMESEAEREDAQASDSDESGLPEPAPARGLAEVEQPQDRVRDVFEDACDSESESEGPLAGLAPRRSHCSGEREAATTGSMTNDPPNTTTGRTIGSGAVGSLDCSASLSGPTVTGDLLATQSCNCPGLGQRLESQLHVHVSGCQQSTLANVTARPGVSTSGSQALPVATPATSGSGLGGNHHGPNSSESSSPASVSTWTPQTSATATPRSVGTSIGVDAPRPHWQFRRLRVGPGGVALPVPDWSLIGDRPGPRRRGPDGDLEAPSESAITMVVPLVAHVPVPALEYAPTATETRRGLSRAATGAGVTQSGAPSQVGSTSTTSHGAVHQREATSSSSLRGLRVKAAWTRDAEGT